MTVQEAAEALRLSVPGIQRRLQSGRMRGEKIGRDWTIPRAEVERWKIIGRQKPGRHKLN